MLSRSERTQIVTRALSGHVPEDVARTAALRVALALEAAGDETLKEIEPLLPSIDDLIQFGQRYRQRVEATDDTPETEAAWQELRETVGRYDIPLRTLAPILYALSALAGVRSEQNLPDGPAWDFVKDHLEMGAEGAAGLAEPLLARRPR